jgi:hypothetical protein
MTNEEIIELAKKAGVDVAGMKHYDKQLTRFARLAVAKELREMAAKQEKYNASIPLLTIDLIQRADELEGEVKWHQNDAHYSREIPNELTQAITALKQAIKEAEEAEPHYWAYTSKITGVEVATAQPPDRVIEPEQFYIKPLYTHPAKPWQGLSDEEVGRLTVFDGLHHIETPLLAKFIRAVEAVLKEKNT